MINIQGLSHKYRNKRILEEVNLVVNEGERCALVGRNGSGKSTLIHALLGVLPIQKGSVELAGHPVKSSKWKKDVAYLPEKFHLYPHLTARENVYFFASLQDKKVDELRVDDVLKQVSLYDHRNERSGGFSKGMLQRLGLALMLYYGSKLLILDEPTSGLDPIGRKDILKILNSLDGKTIFLSSHHLDEIQQLCTHVAYLDEGILTKYTVEAFMKKMQEGEETNEPKKESTITSIHSRSSASRM